ncbi:MAG: molybdenum ABC transporter ATP-binding protein [Pseudomonadales bacterium]|nr:molybdenum ABC transporter ATP-binding protein [Pseudomonadales bacterium]
MVVVVAGVLEARFLLRREGFTLDAQLRLPARGVSALFGPSGCGKTTLLRCMAGLERVAGGQMRLGERIWQDDRQFVPVHQRALALVFQDANLFEHLDVRQNLSYGLRRVKAAERRVSLDHAIELLGIGALLKRRPGSLSGGERQRVAIARALAVSPRLLLMDEPLAALDAARKAEVLPYLERLHQELDIPVIYVSHALDEVARLADQLVLMEAGRVLASGPLVEMLSRLDLPLQLGEDAGVVLPARIAVRDERWQLARLDVDGGSLWTRDLGHACGSAVRVRVLARDVSLALTALPDTSISNQLPCVVEQLADDTHPANLLVRVRFGSSALLARLTRRSAVRLALQPGMAVWAQVKTVALSE